MHRFRYWIAIAAIALLLNLTGCDRDNNHPGYDYFPDMAYSQAYETNSVNPNFKDGKTMREPVKGTISRDFIAYPYQKTDANRLLAGKTLSNPLEANAQNIERGKEVYLSFCIHCHGDLGDGKGHLFTSGKYPFPPKSLITDRMKAVPDGEIYHVITVGFGIMGAHGSQIRPEDRWKTVLYIRKELQKKQ
jgi:mono/diheme cytochrome c family protein